MIHNQDCTHACNRCPRALRGECLAPGATAQLVVRRTAIAVEAGQFLQATKVAKAARECGIDARVWLAPTQIPQGTPRPWLEPLRVVRRTPLEAQERERERKRERERESTPTKARGSIEHLRRVLQALTSSERQQLLAQLEGR